MATTSSFTKVINSLWGMYMVTDPGGVHPDAPGVAPDPASMPNPWGKNGLIGVDAPWHATICAGTKYGPVNLTVEVHDSRPSGQGIGDQWSEIVEVDFQVVSGQVVFTDWDGVPIHTLSIPSGGWRLRAHARGRDEGDAQQYELVGDNYVEEHLVQLFPGPRLGETVIQVKDRTGGYLRGDIKPDPLPE
jgi:hypothetical protein